MNTQATERMAAALMQSGELPDAKPWEIGAAVTWIADALGRRDPGVTDIDIRRATEGLNGRLLFEHTRLLGQTWKDCCGFDPEITKRHAQALIELSSTAAAEQLLLDALAQVNLPGAGAVAAKERLEYQGLLGRVAKQRYVVNHDLDQLVEATDRYLAQYQQPSQPYWHGINAMALLAREEREGVARGLAVTTAGLAREIYSKVEKLYAKNREDPWLPATASEACLALGDCDGAEFWLYRLLHHPNVKPFTINSYERQIREIWQGSVLGQTTCADRLAAILTRHIARTQQRWSVASGELKNMVCAIEKGIEQEGQVFEKNFTNQTGFDIATIREMLARCASIGCVTNATGERLGTGFLLDGAALTPAYAGGPVFVTNAHVISETVANAIRPAQARVLFEIESSASGSLVYYKVEEVLFTSEPAGVSEAHGANLDVTIVRLASLPSTFAGLPLNRTLPLIDARTRAYVVGHPRGSGLQVSLHDSLLLDIDDEDCRVHYRTPTDPGSSGSPVFNAVWDVIAVHHSGSSKTPRLRGTGHYEANEGISLDAVCRHLAG